MHKNQIWAKKKMSIYNFEMILGNILVNKKLIYMMNIPYIWIAREIFVHFFDFRKNEHLVKSE